MAKSPERTTLTVSLAEGVWIVEHEGRFFGRSTDKQVAVAAAAREARVINDSGRLCQLRIAGEIAFTHRG